MDFKILTIYFAIIIILLCVIYRMLVRKNNEEPHDNILDKKMNLLSIKAVNLEIKKIVSEIYFDPDKIDKEDAENMFIYEIATLYFRGIRGNLPQRRDLARRYLRVLQSTNTRVDDSVSQVYFHKLKMLDMKLHSEYLTVEEEKECCNDIYNIEQKIIRYINERYNRIITTKEI